jgi:glycerol-3-phosphate acyltransferase PlsY
MIDRFLLAAYPPGSVRFGSPLARATGGVDLRAAATGPVTYAVGLTAVIIVVRHRASLHRLAKGTARRLGEHA